MFLEVYLLVDFFNLTSLKICHVKDFDDDGATVDLI
jgi:hypothetical protein